MNKNCKKVYGLVSKIPKGNVTTYNSVARALGNKNLARYVGYCMKTNPDTKKVPCHRVIKSDGSAGDYSNGGTERKMRLLEREGVRFVKGRVDLKIFEFKF